MTGNLYQDWPVYLLLGATAVFFIYVVIKSNFKGKQNNPKTKDKEKTL